MKKQTITLFLILLLSITVHAKKHPNKKSKKQEVLRYNLIDGLHNIYLDSGSEKIGHTWSKGSVWDKKLIQKFYALLPKNAPFVVFDLGAQTGCFSLLAKYFPQSSWYAFEPIREAADILKKNLKLNQITNVQVYQTAVANFCGKTTLRMPDMGNWGLSTIGSNILRFNSLIEREVLCISLDNFVELYQIKKVDFMKIDTEGSELSILKGAQKMLMRDHPILLMEYNETNMEQCGVTKQEMDDFLTLMGYEWILISNEDILCTPLRETINHSDIQ